MELYVHKGRDETEYMMAMVTVLTKEMGGLRKTNSEGHPD